MSIPLQTLANLPDFIPRLRDVPVTADTRAFFVPGRIEVAGKHTDYAGGRSLLCTVERGFTFLVNPRQDQIVHLTADGRGEASFELQPDLQPVQGHWSNYPMTVARRVARNFLGPLRGADITFTSNLPADAGMSSSSALVVGCFLCLAAVNHLAGRREYQFNIHSLEDLGGYLGTVENGQTFGTLLGDKGVGTFGGSEDHTAILCSEPGRLKQYSFCPVRHEHTIHFPEDYSFAIAVSGVVADKTGSALASYNNASLLARAALDQWNALTGRGDPTLAAALASDRQAYDRLYAHLMQQQRSDLAARLDHFNFESNVIVNAVRELLGLELVPSAADWINRSQARQALLGNQVEQTVFLAHAATQWGMVGASAFGAGFGGSVYAVIKTYQADAFITYWKQKYQEKFPGEAARAHFFATRPGLPAVELAPAAVVASDR